MPVAFAPGSINELEKIVAWAVAEGSPLEVVGNGTKRGLGRPVRAEYVLETRELAGVDGYEPQELVMSAGAGTPLALIERDLAERGQELAFEPPDMGLILSDDPGRQTIGGVFAANLAGPKRLRSGAARDHILGCQVVTGHGQIVKAGGRVIKNVTGYDVSKLMAGSFGTLAVISHVTFKVLPRPETEATLCLSGADAATLLGRLRRATGTAYDVAGAAYLPAKAAARSKVAAVKGAGRGLALIRVQGAHKSVAYRVDRLREILGVDGITADALDGEASAGLWREVRDVRLLDPDADLWRLSVPPTAAATLLDRLDAIGETLFDLAGGLVWLAVPETAFEAATGLRALIGHDGHASLVRGSVAGRAQDGAFQPVPEAVAALTRRVKHSFDPKGVLNPGRLAIA